MSQTLDQELEELLNDTLLIDANSCLQKLHLGNVSVVCARLDNHQGCHFGKIGNAFVAWKSK